MPQVSGTLAWALWAALTTLGGEIEAKCCFTNPAYMGVCEVVPSQHESCQSILDYLNTPNSAGKGYCGESSVRGGWQQASCKAGTGDARP